jgi:hypothetical protein
LKKYKKKFIVSGDILELYEYENDIYTDYDLSKFRDHPGRCNSSITDEDTKKMNRAKTSNRSARNVRRLVNSNIEKNSKFVTLTFEEDIRELKDANYIFKKFKQRLEYQLKINLKYLCVPEFTKKGRVHFHVIFFNLPFIKNTTLGMIWGHGFIKINKIDNCDNVGSYVAKYMTKENEKLIEQKSYFTSRNLEKPIEIINEKEIEILADSLSPTDVVYLNSFVNDYLGLVNYTQYNLKRQEVLAKYQRVEKRKIIERQINSIENIGIY